MAVNARGRMVTPDAWQVAPATLEHADRAAWLELRRRYVCASDVPVISGAKVYGRTRWQLYVDKVQGAVAEMSPRQAEQARFGHRMEAVAAAEWRDRYPGARLARVGMLASVEYPWLAANLDRRVFGCPDGDGPCGWECKNRGAYAAAEWDRDAGPDAIPDGPMLQVQAQMIVTGYRHMHLAVVIGGYELRPYRVDADDHLAKLLVEETRWFWFDCVQARTAPPVDEAERTGHILARLWKVSPDKVKAADPDTMDRLGNLRAAIRHADGWAGEVMRLKHELMAWTGDAEAVTDPTTGDRLFTWKQNGTFRAGDFRAAQPALWDEYAEPSRTVNTARLARDHPEIYRQYRARAFRVCTTGEETG